MGISSFLKTVRDEIRIMISGDPNKLSHPEEVAKEIQWRDDLAAATQKAARTETDMSPDKPDKKTFKRHDLVKLPDPHNLRIAKANEPVTTESNRKHQGRDMRVIRVNADGTITAGYKLKGVPGVQHVTNPYFVHLESWDSSMTTVLPQHSPTSEEFMDAYLKRVESAGKSASKSKPSERILSDNLDLTRVRLRTAHKPFKAAVLPTQATSQSEPGALEASASAPVDGATPPPTILPEKPAPTGVVRALVDFRDAYPLEGPLVAQAEGVATTEELKEPASDASVAAQPAPLGSDERETIVEFRKSGPKKPDNSLDAGPSTVH